MDDRTRITSRRGIRTDHGSGITFTITINVEVGIDEDSRVVKRRHDPEPFQQYNEDQRNKKKFMPNNYVKPANNIQICQIPWSNVTSPVMIPFTKGTYGNSLDLETNLTNIGRYQNSGKSHPLCFDFQNVMYSNPNNVTYDWLDTVDQSIDMLESQGIMVSDLIFVLGGRQDNVLEFCSEISKREYICPFIIIDAQTKFERNQDDNIVYSIGAILEGIIVSNDQMSKREDLLYHAQCAKTSTDKNVIKEHMKNYFGYGYVMDKSRDCRLPLTYEHNYLSMLFPKDLFFIYNK